MIYFNRVCKLLLLAITINCVSSFGNYTLPYLDSPCCKEIFVKNEITIEVRVLQTVKDAFSIMKRTLHILERFYNDLKSSVPDKAEKHSYLIKLSNSFTLCRRMSNLWPSRLSLMEMTFGRVINTPTQCSFVNFITEEATFMHYTMQGKVIEYSRHYTTNTSALWRSAMTGLVRLQETYALDTADLASGRSPLPSVDANNTVLSGGYDTVLSATDCYDIGVYCMEVGVPVRAAEWLMEASRRVEDHPGVSVARINEYLQVAYCYTGNLRSYWKMFRSLFDHQFFLPTQDLKTQYGEMISSSCKTLKQIYVVDPFSEILNRGDMLSVVHQRGLCRKNTTRLAATDKNLRCRMLHYNQTYLRIGPLKMEELKIDPPVLLFHQVVFEAEIRSIIEESLNETRPAIFDYGRGYGKYQDTQFNYWLYEENSKLVKMWDKKSAIIANAALPRGEPPMIASYGLAGEIRMHMDLGDDEKIMNPYYSRADYLTLMYWLNQPEEGGFTIFPNLELAVVPVKGSAVLWFNRHPNWDRDRRTVHTGCPILTGTKWVLTKWFHVLGQHFPKCVPGMERSRKYYYLESNIEE